MVLGVFYKAITAAAFPPPLTYTLTPKTFIRITKEKEKVLDSPGMHVPKSDAHLSGVRTTHKLPLAASARFFISELT